MRKKVTVLGAGSWGTALAQVLALNQNEVVLWGHREEHLKAIQQSGVNAPYLPGIPLKLAGCRFEPDLARAIQGVEAVVVAVPSKAYREVIPRLRGYEGILVSVTKGIEHDSGLTMGGVLQEIVPAAQVATLSGPTIAQEVARQIPTACVAASSEEWVQECVQRMFHCATFRVYTSGDVLGVELGGALKNVIAIGAGLGDGLGFGDNAKAALITRAIVEVRRLGVACGALPETFAGLSGLGDLTVTCFSRLSRNRMFGEQLARGGSVEDLMSHATSVVEGYPTARSAHRLAQVKGAPTPIIDQVYSVLYEGKEIRQAVIDLTNRDSRPEHDEG